MPKGVKTLQVANRAPPVFLRPLKALHHVENAHTRSLAQVKQVQNRACKHVQLENFLRLRLGAVTNVLLDGTTMFMDKRSLRHANIAKRENLIPMKEVQLNLAACYVLKVGINPKNLWITATSVM